MHACAVSVYSETCIKRPHWGHKMVAFIDRWSLNTGQNILRRHLWDITEWPLNTGGL